MVRLWLTVRFNLAALALALEHVPGTNRGLVRVAGLEPARAKLRGF